MKDVNYKRILIVTGVVFVAGVGLKYWADFDDPLKGQKTLTRDELRKRGQEYAEKMAKRPKLVKPNSAPAGAENQGAAATATPAASAPPVEHKEAGQPSQPGSNTESKK